MKRRVNVAPAVPSSSAVVGRTLGLRGVRSEHEALGPRTPSAQAEDVSGMHEQLSFPEAQVSAFRLQQSHLVARAPASD